MLGSYKLRASPRACWTSSQRYNPLKESFCCCDRFCGPTTGTRRDRVLDEPDAPGGRINIVDIARVFLPLSHGKRRIYRHPDELDIVDTQQGLVRPFDSKLEYEHHDLAKPLVRPARCESLTETRVGIAPINLSLTGAIRGGNLVDVKL